MGRSADCSSRNGGPEAVQDWDHKEARTGHGGSSSTGQLSTEWELRLQPEKDESKCLVIDQFVPIWVV